MLVVAIGDYCPMFRVQFDFSF